MSSRLPTIVRSMLLASIVLVGSSSSQIGQAAEYKEEQPNANLVEKEKAVLQQVGRILRGTIPFDEKGKSQLSAYYLHYAFPQLTIKENWGKLPELREGLLRDLRSTKNQEVFQNATAMIFSKMRTFADPKENFHPAVRYNAVLLLGELNAVERRARSADGGRPATYPDPLPSALDVLLAEYQNPDQIDAVRVAALVGIDRHVKLDLARAAERRIPGAKKQLIFSEMIALLNASPPAGRSVEGHAWMQRRAIDMLAVLGTVGTKPEANAALEKIVADNDAPISLRCTASEALAQWAPTSQAKIDASKVSKNLGLIAVKACKDELDRIAALELQEKEMKQLRDLIKKSNPVASGQFRSASGASGGMEGSSEQMYGGGGQGYVGGGEQEEDTGFDSQSMYNMTGGGGMTGSSSAVLAVPTDPRIIWSQRRLKYQLTCVKRGLEGMTIAGKSSSHEKAVDQVAKAVEKALALTDPPEDKPDLEGLAESIRKGVSLLAFLTPEAAELGMDPVAELPDSAALPGEPPVPAADPANPPAENAAEPGVVPDLPPGL